MESESLVLTSLTFEVVLYLILTKFREYLISRKVKRHISRVLNFAILKGNWNWSVLNFAIFYLEVWN